MNVKNNKRHQETIENIEKAFVLLLKDNELKEISVTELCKTAGINRSTFYANSTISRENLIQRASARKRSAEAFRF